MSNYICAAVKTGLADLDYKFILLQVHLLLTPMLLRIGASESAPGRTGT